MKHSARKIVIPTLSRQDHEFIYQAAEALVGTCQEGSFRREVLVTNVSRRMMACGMEDLNSYFAYVDDHDEELAHLISALTIHTTSWFREYHHFDRVISLTKARLEAGESFHLRIISVACSTGEEVYSFALVLEFLRQSHPSFDYEIEGRDIDQTSLDKARRSVYQMASIEQIPKKYRQFILFGSGNTQGFFTVSKEIRKRCRFLVENIIAPNAESAKYDFIICRNVLIYFSEAQVEAIVQRLAHLLNERGTLILGLSESIEHEAYELHSLQNSVYTKQKEEKKAPETLNALVVDDSATMRQVLISLLSRQHFNVHAVESADAASKYLSQHSVDLITLDLHMPKKDGLTWLKECRTEGLRTPIVVVSDVSEREASEVLGALEHGAQDYIEKAKLHRNREETAERLRMLAEGALQLRRGQRRSSRKDLSPLSLEAPDVIVIGASTGGTEALTKLLARMPKDGPPLLVVQHIATHFAKPFAERLAKVTGLELGSIHSGEVLQAGRLYMPLADYHIGIALSRSKQLELRTSSSDPILSHRPSVDYLFHSLSEVLALQSDLKVMAVLLTGMGRDGAQGMLKLYQKQAMTLAQSEESCVIFGMPREAIKLNAARYVGDLIEIREQIDLALQLRGKAKAS